MDLLDRLLRPEILGVMIPIVAILTGGAIAISARFARHRERLAMIERGMHPDHPARAEIEAESEDESADQDRIEIELSRRERIDV